MKTMTHLQGIGDVPGTPLNACKIGDVRVYNYGYKATITGIDPIGSGTFINLTVLNHADGMPYTKRMKATTLIALAPR